MHFNRIKVLNPTCLARYRCQALLACGDPTIQSTGGVLLSPRHLCQPPIVTVMSKSISRNSHVLSHQTAVHRPLQRVAQVRRHLSATPTRRAEVQDAYILSAARTPTGKVMHLCPCGARTILLTDPHSSMAPSFPSQHPNLALRPSDRLCPSLVYLWPK